MGVIVQKYGGSSVSDIEKLNAVAERIAKAKQETGGLVVVVSAMGNTTDELISLAQSLTNAPDRRELDMLISVGERISMSLLAMALKARGVDAISLTGSQSGIITNESHTDAQIVEVRPHRVQASLDRGQVVIVAGFQGVSRRGEVTTLGRGGSDTTAVALAAALNASMCEIFSDVDGLYSADPSVVGAAQIREAATLAEVRCLASSGARILYEGAVAYAQRHEITLVLRSAFSDTAGTRVSANEDETDGVLVVAIDDDVVVLPVTSVGDTCLQLALSCGGKLRLGTTESYYVSLTNVPSEDLFSGTAVALVTIVGEGWIASSGGLSTLVGRLQSQYPSTAIVHSDSERLVLCVCRLHSARLASALHAELLET
jgi:aspartate kinase